MTEKNTEERVVEITNQTVEQIWAIGRRYDHLKSSNAPATNYGCEQIMEEAKEFLCAASKDKGQGVDDDGLSEIADRIAVMSRQDGYRKEKRGAILYYKQAILKLLQSRFSQPPPPPGGNEAEVNLEALTQQVASALAPALIYKTKHALEVTPYTGHFRQAIYDFFGVQNPKPMPHSIIKTYPAPDDTREEEKE